jgi:ribonuclease I
MERFLKNVLRVSRGGSRFASFQPPRPMKNDSYHTYTLMLRWNNGFCKTLNVVAISKEAAIADAKEAYDFDWILNALK